VALLALGLLVLVAAPLLVPLITPGFTAAQTELAVRLTRIMVLSPILLALGSVATSALNARGRFSASALAPIAYNLAIILAAVVLGPVMGVDGLAIGVVLGSLGHVLVQLPAILRARGFRYDLRIDLSDPSARQALLLMGPRALGMGAGQITFLVNTTLASGLGVGAIVAYNVAFTILQIPIGVLGVPLGIVLLPAMARALATGAWDEFGRLVVRSLRLLLYVMLFLTAVAIVLREQVVTLLFEYGRFDQRAIDLTASTLLLFLLGLAGHALIVVLARAFYAGQDTRTPVIAAILSVGVNVAISVGTVGTLGLSGLALGIAVGAWVEAGLLTILLQRRTPGLRLDPLVRALGEFALGAALAGLAAAAVLRGSELLVGVDPGKVAVALQVAAAGLAAAAVYLVYSRLLRVPELPQAFDLLRGSLRRGGTAGDTPAP
jgi:putative peptidoglycan lipid II flippase